MSGSDAEAAGAIDFAVAAYREDGVWQVNTLPPRAATELDHLQHALSQQPSDAGALGMVSVNEDYFVLVRVSGGHARLLLSDVGAATESPLAMSVLERLELPPPDDDEDQVQPAGDLSILTDLGLSAMELGAMCDDLDLYPDEVLTDVAARLGFGREFEEVLDAVNA
ncbi:MAG: tRNA adenosine deaminase-associated protein [Nocardioidaceae bacterium]